MDLPKDWSLPKFEPKVAAEPGKLAAAAAEAGKRAGEAGNAAKGFFGKAFDILIIKPSQFIVGKTAGAANFVVVGPARAAGGALGSGVVWTAKQPVAAAAFVVNKAWRGIGHGINAARGNPWTAGVIALGAGAVLVGNAVRSGAERRTRKELLEQAASAQGGQNSYQISADDAAALNARMKQPGQSNGFAAAELAARAGASPEQATTR